MKFQERTLIGGSIVIGFIMFSSGCATGPKYVYVEQQNSAMIEGFGVPSQGPENGSCAITIKRIDGMNANFEASLPGNNWPLHEPRQYLAPGTHALDLDISEIDEVIGVNGKYSGVIGETTAGSRPTITVKLEAKHVYRLTAALYGENIDLTLWDETSGSVTRSRVANWTIDGNKGYSENPVPSGSHR